MRQWYYGEMMRRHHSKVETIKIFILIHRILLSSNE